MKLELIKIEGKIVGYNWVPENMGERLALEKIRNLYLHSNFIEGTVMILHKNAQKFLATDETDSRITFIQQSLQNLTLTDLIRFGGQIIEIHREKPEKMSVEELLKRMKEIAGICLKAFLTDFTEKDTAFVYATAGKEAFVWLVYESGTYICQLSDNVKIKQIIREISDFEREHTAFWLYVYDCATFDTIDPYEFKNMAEKQIKE